MNSNKPTRKQKRREANQNQYSKREFPASTERSSPSQLVDMSSHDEGEGVNSKSSIIHQTSDSGTVSQLSHEMKSHKGKISIKPQSPSTGHRSPYFHEPQLPSNRPHAAPKHSRNPVEDLANGHNSPKKLDDRFIPTNGSRRSLDVNMSSEADELQMGTTIGNNPDSNVLSSIKRPRDKSPGKNMPLTVTTISSTGKDPGLDPSIIKHSEFKSTEPKLPNDRFSGPPVREKKAPWAVDVAAVSLPGHLETRTGMDLVHDERMGSYILKIDGQDSGIRVLPRKLQKIYWEHSGRKVRFMSSKIGTEENLVDLEFLREKQVHDLLVRLETLPGCKPIGRSRYVSVQVLEGMLYRLTKFSEQMEKMFEKRRSEYQRNTTSSPLNPSRLIEPRLDENGAQLPKVHQETIVNTEKARNEPRKRSIVDDLLARAFPEDPVKATRLSTKTIPNGLPREKSISEQLERLKPKHNEHLRRSIRTSSEFKVPYTDHLDDLDEMPTIERYSKTHDLGEPWKKPLIYPKIGRKKVTIEFTDLERLDEGQYLNDNLLSFYLRFLEHSLEEQRPDLAKRVYFFNTYFFATLMNTHKGKKGFNYEGVQKWTRNVDLFTYDYIVVPINEASHWYLAIICNLPALDRDISLREESPSLSANTVNINDASRLSAPTSSPTIDLSMGKPLDTIRKAKDPDEREARDSFAEMSLNPDVTLSSADDVTRRENPASGNAGSMDEDQEMLDGMNQGATSPRTDEAAIPADNLEEIAEEASQDQYQNRKVAARSKKAKRKSGPPAVTRTPPDKPVIITFDSLGVARSPTVKILKDYLREEAKAKRGGMEFEPGQIKGITASQIPQQDNFYDCGVFLLGYVAKFLEADPKDFIAKIIRREYDEIKDWPNLRPSTLRNSIREQVIKLHEDQAVERHRERNAQKNGKGDITQEQKSHQNSTAAVDQAKELDSEPRPPSIEAASAKANFPPQPATRKDALTTALTLDADNVKAKIQDISSQYKPKAPMQLTQQELKDQEAVLKPAKREAAECEKGKQRLPDPSDNGTPVVLIESQSQRDDSAPKSSTGSQLTYLAHNLNQKSPELPAEIQDSQPSQTTQKAPKKDKSGASDQTELVQEIPIVQLEDPRGTKRRKTGKAAVSAEDDTPGTSTETNQANTSSKRKRSGRKAQRSDEVINIDD